MRRTGLSCVDVWPHVGALVIPRTEVLLHQLHRVVQKARVVGAEEELLAGASPEHLALRFASCQGGHEERMKSMSDAVRILRAPSPSVPHRRMALASSLRRMRSSNLRGDYFEFGLYRGSSFSAAHTLSRRYGLASEMRFFGFDSFRGPS